MDFPALLNQFHFLRPYWLLLLLPAAVLMWRVYRRSDAVRGWKQLISPHLLEHLLVDARADSGRWRPVYMLGIAWLVGIVALAGPSWKMQPSPFSEDQSAMFIVVKITPEMLARDIQPSRLQRAALKIRDLLALKPDVKTGLIAYAGSAHLVVPLTSDAGIINTFAAALEPDIMPSRGDEPAAAIALASQRLKQAGVPGSIVLITDSVDASQLEKLREIYQRDSIETHILGMAAGPEVIPPAGSYPAPPLDMESLRKAARAMGGTVIPVTADKRDVDDLAAQVERSITSAPAQEGQQWQDQGYYLVALLLLVMLTFFRQGGAVTVE